MIEIPEAFARATIDREGEAGGAWLATLPTLAEDLIERWQCVLDGVVTHGGVGLIVPVRRLDQDEHQQAAVLKISFPHPGNVAEPDAFKAWDGRGAVRLYERDDEHFAMLLERAHTSTLAEVLDNDEIARVTGRLNRRLAIPAPPGLPRLSDLADEWDESLRRDARELTGAVPLLGIPQRLPRRAIGLRARPGPGPCRPVDLAARVGRGSEPSSEQSQHSADQAADHAHQAGTAAR
jgi:streptomycin 6-kinase